MGKIQTEICDGISKHIDNKRKFYEEYFSENFKLFSNKTMSYNSEMYITNFIKNYIFNEICLDVLESNKITNEDDIKKIISLYYDHTKLTAKLLLTVNDIDKRLQNFDSN